MNPEATKFTNTPELRWDWWREYSIDWIHTGSRVIVYPSPKNTDDDYLLLINAESLEAFRKLLRENGYHLGGSMGDAPSALREYPTVEDTRKKRRCFESYRKEEQNLIVTISPEYFQNFRKATYLARYMNLHLKEHRVMLFEAVCADKWPDIDY